MKELINILKKVLDDHDDPDDKVSGGTLIDKKQSIRLQRGGAAIRKFKPENFEESFKTIIFDNYEELLKTF